MNEFKLMGRLTDDGVKAYGKDNNVATYTVAVRKDYKNKSTGKYDTDFIPVTVFDKKKNQFTKGQFPHMKKGKVVAVTGHAIYNSYVDKDGIKRYETKLIHDEIKFI